MEFERLALEVGAAKEGLTAVRPRALNGVSGAEHRFSLLFTDGAAFFAFDIYDDVGEAEMLRSYIKKLDSGASVSVVCRPSRVTGAARSLGAEHGMRVLDPEAPATFFSVETVSPKPASV